MIKASSKRRVRMAAISLGLALAVSVIAVPATGAQPAPQAKEKNNLVIMIGEKDAPWCNQDSAGIDQVSAKNSVLETLTLQNDAGKMVPYLAKTVTSNATKDVWTVTLNEGIMFTDGEELTSDTLEVNYQALTGSIKLFQGGKGQSASLPAITWMDISGITSAIAGKTAPALFGPMMSTFKKFFVKKSKYVVEFNLRAPNPEFINNLWGNGRNTVMSTKSLLDPNCGITPAATIGTGPFKVLAKGIDPFTTKLVANATYWRSTKANPLPKASAVEFKVVQDGAQRVNALRRGTADIATFGSTSNQQLTLLTTLKSKITLLQGPRDTTWNMHLNTTALPFSNKNARLAFSYALDVVKFTKLNTGPWADPAVRIATKGHPYYVSAKSAQFDLAKAKAAVKAYKTETNKPLAIVMPIADSVESAKTGNAVCKMMKAAGMTCELMAPTTSTAYILRGFALQQQLSWFNVVAGNSASFANLFSRKTDLELSGFRFTNPALAACFESAMQSGKVSDYRGCAKTIQDEAYWVPTYSEGGFIAFNNNVKGLGKTPLAKGGFRPPLGLSGFDFASVTK